MENVAQDLEMHPLHLGLGARAIPLPPITGPQWYDEYSACHTQDGLEGRLVSLFRFTESWDSWEMHPSGDEVVLCVSGRILLHQQHSDGTSASITLRPQEYAINPPGTWHTADIHEQSVALFITAGAGTQHRAR